MEAAPTRDQGTAMTGDFLFNFLTVFLGSGAAIAVTRFIYDYRKDRRLRADAAEYLAFQLAFLLEGYAVECAQQASDHDTARQSDGHAGGLISRVPAPASLPESDAYKLLDRSLLNDVLDFPQRCQMANEAAMFWWNVVGDQDCCSEAMEENTILMGGRAVDIATRLRATYKLGSRDLTFGTWNIRNFFAKELKRLEERNREKQETKANTVMFPVAEPHEAALGRT
jgi:hypothetical protein